MDKSTQELLNELKHCGDMQEYLKDNQQELYDKDLKEYLGQLLQSHQLTKAEVIQKSNLHEIYAYQIFAGKKSPSRDKLLTLGFGMSLSLEEMQRYLKIAGVSELYARHPRDCAILFALHKGLSLMDCNAMLLEQGFEILG